MDFATKVKFGTAFKECAEALLSTLWIHHGEAFPSFRLMEHGDHNIFKLEVKAPASDEHCDQKVVMFSFSRNDITELTLYYDTEQAERGKGLNLVDVGVHFKHTYSEAGRMLMAYYNQVLHG